METRMMEATRTATSTVLVEKRDGRIVDFDAANIINAIKAAFTDLNKQVGPQQEDLIITLKSYLKNNQNLSKTAQELYVHYKTAAYRIEKIARITGMDFDNANEMLAVRIGLVVCKMIENYNKK